MTDNLNERLGISSTGADATVEWFDIVVVGDQRRKKRNEDGKNKISVIDLLSHTLPTLPLWDLQ